MRGGSGRVGNGGLIRLTGELRMIAVLVEELERAGVSGRVEVPSVDELDYDVPPMSPMP